MTVSPSIGVRAGAGSGAGGSMPGRAGAKAPRALFGLLIQCGDLLRRICQAAQGSGIAFQPVGQGAGSGRQADADAFHCMGGSGTAVGHRAQGPGMYGKFAHA